mgnify:CR=1 FL=1
MAAKADLDATTTSLEGQVFEAMRELKQAEDAWIAAGLALDPPETRTRRTTFNLNPVTGIATISVNMPISEADAADGVTYTANPYIV